MSFCKLGMVAILGAAAVAPFTALESQEPGQPDPAAALDDPDFRLIANAGPTNSAELSKLVTTYAANGMNDEVTQAFARYLSRDNAVTDPYCAYCQSLILAGHRFDEDPLAGPLVDSMDIVVTEAFRSRATTALMRLAVMTASSRIPEHRDRSLYFLSAAAQLGIEDAWRDDVIQVLANSGLISEALTVAKAIYDNPESEHYQTEPVRQWIAYLSEQISRNELVGEMIVSAATR
jgi:hypothetical protein